MQLIIRFPVIGAYVLLCLAYSLSLKEIVILDVILISSGFVIRAISGAVLSGVEVSNGSSCVHRWLHCCRLRNAG